MTKISDASLVPSVSGNEKMPTGQPGDLAITVSQIKNHVLWGTKYAVIYCGEWDLSSNTVPTTGGTGAGGSIMKGNEFRVAVSSTTLEGPDGSPIVKGYMARALVDAPGTDLTDETKWLIYSTLTA